MDQGTTYDVFVSHNGRDKPIVERLCRALLEAGVRPWFDKWDLAPGDVWMREIERMLETVPAVVVCVGAHGLSAWHEAEQQAAVDRATTKGTGVVVPVLLPGAPEHVELPVFLRRLQWVDLRAEPAWEDGIARLAASITGRETQRGPWVDEGRERPYRGLQPFTEADAGWMFGREREEAELLDALRNGERFIVVVGASGSGKSSLVRAGVVPAMRTGAIEGAQRWHALVMRPGARPCQELALKLSDLQQEVEGPISNLVEEGDALEELGARLRTSESRLTQTVDLLLGRRGRDDQLLLVVDQFEELFTASVGRDARESAPAEQGDDLGAGARLDGEGIGLLRNLLHSTCAESGRVRVIITVRADFTGECLSVPVLAERMKRMHFALPPMKAEQLREAIRRPALRMGYDVEKALADALVNATEDQPGRLPLLQHTLDLLWDVRDRQRHRLSYAAYDEHVGSLDESVARRAEEVFAKLVAESGENELASRRVFLRLVHLGEGTGDTRRRVRRSELLGDAASRVLDLFVEARLLVADDYRGAAGDRSEQVVEIAHEALLGRWGRLRLWIDDSREVVRLRQEVNIVAAQWKKHGQPTDDLWRGGRLARAIEALLDDEVDLTPEERDFLATSRQTEVEQQRSRARLQRRLLVGLSGFSFFLILALVFSITQYRESQRNLRRNEGLRLATVAEMMFSERYSLGSLLVVEAMLSSTERGETADDFVQEVIRRFVPTNVPLRGHKDSVRMASFSSDGEWVVTASEDGTARVWRADGTGEPVVFKGYNGRLHAAGFSTDGKWVVTAEDRVARVWRADGTGNPVVLIGHQGLRVVAASFSSDGKWVVTASDDGTTRVWRADGSGEPVVLRGHDDVVNAASFSSDGEWVITASEDGTARVWRPECFGEPVMLRGHESIVLRGHEGPVRAASFSSDGTWVVTASNDGTARVWRADGTGEPIVLRRHDGPVHAASFSSDGKWVVTASDDGTARVWRADGTGEPVVLHGHHGTVHTASFSSNGQWVVTASEDGTARVWRADGTGEPVVLHDHHGPVYAASFSSDGQRVVTASEDGTAGVWKADGTGEPAVLRGHQGPVHAASFSSDDEWVVTASEDGTARVWRADGFGEPVVLRGHESPVHTASFSSDGQWIVTASEDGTARVWSGDGTGEPVVLRGHEGPVLAASFSSDGKLVVTASEDGTVRTWRADGTGEFVVLHSQEGSLSAASFSSDGEWVVTSSWGDWTARVRRTVGTGEPVVLSGHEGPIVAASFSSDGERVVTASWDGTARVWRRDGTHEPIVRRSQQGAVYAASFSSDGRWVVTASLGGTVHVWRMDGTGDPIVLRGHQDTVNAASFSSDSDRVVTASNDGTARVWLTDPATLVPRICRSVDRNLTRSEWRFYIPDRPYRETCAPYLR